MTGEVLAFLGAGRAIGPGSTGTHYRLRQLCELPLAISRPEHEQC